MPESETQSPFDAMVRMADLTRRAAAVSTKVQSRALAQANGSEYALMDASTLAQAYTAYWTSLALHPQKLFETNLALATNLSAIWTSLLPLQGEAKTTPVKDRRFADDSWSSDQFTRSLRDVYLSFESAMLALLDDLPVDDRNTLRVKFFTRQAVNALSPANYLATNAVARNKFLETQGASALDGIENLIQDLERGDGRLDIKTNDPDAFEVGVDLATTEGEVVFQNELIQLIQYHPRTEEQHEVPMLFVPAWINKFYIMDMQPKNSLIRYALDQGHSVFVISWANPTKQHADLDFADYMQLGPLTALDVIRDITKEDKANVLGFCIGGILVTAMLGYLEAIGEADRINTATTLATMMDFSDVGEIGVFIDENRLELLRDHMAETGYLEAHHLQDMFSMLRENDLIWSFHEKNYLCGAQPRAFDLLFWNADATRLPRAMLLWYLKQVYLENQLRQPGGLQMNGVDIDISKVKTPVFVLATKEDHIAPWTSIYPATQVFGGEVEFVLGGSGHIAGVINPPGGRAKYGYSLGKDYPEAPADFLANTEQHEGSWWPHWTAWLAGKDGETVAARKPARRGKYKSIEAAPGSFVKAH
ncbi:MAG: class I poly(R)-hydroxyalkanoic acid synthase [Pseudomonadota bacterium]